LLDETVTVAVQGVAPALPGRRRDRATDERAHVREARSAARIDHPTRRDDLRLRGRGRQPWIVMELGRGMSLAQEWRREKNGPIPPVPVAEMGLRLLAPSKPRTRSASCTATSARQRPARAATGASCLTIFGGRLRRGRATLNPAGAMVGHPSTPRTRADRGPKPRAPAVRTCSRSARPCSEGPSRPVPAYRSAPRATLGAVRRRALFPRSPAGPMTPVLKDSPPCSRTGAGGEPAR